MRRNNQCPYKKEADKLVAIGRDKSEEENYTATDAESLATSMNDIMDIEDLGRWCKNPPDIAKKFIGTG